MPSLAFYPLLVSIVFRASSKAKRGHYGDEGWSDSSLEVCHALEQVGVRFEVTGSSHFINLQEPCVFIGNHMSTLETLVMPGIIEPFKDITFIVKQDLIEMPVFKHVMRSRNPITVGRTNPREDLAAVFEGGTERLRTGRSIIVFPQTTRTPAFDPKAFNSMGVKLAKRAGVSVIPFALKTDAWGIGSFVKDFGRIDPSRTVYFDFHKPLRIRGNGTEEHQIVLEFITKRLKVWGGAVADPS